MTIPLRDVLDRTDAGSLVLPKASDTAQFALEFLFHGFSSAQVRFLAAEAPWMAFDKTYRMG